MKTRLLKFLAGLLSADDRRTVARAIFASSRFEYAIVRTEEGRFFVDIADDVVSWSLLRHGFWEPFETTVVKRLLRAGDVFVNVGANIGWYAVIADRLTQPNGRVIAIEPDAHNLELLARNLGLNAATNTRAMPFAIYDDAAVSFKKSKENYGDHQLVTDARHDAIDVRPLDDVVADMGVVRLMMLDTQGAEPGVLRSGTRTLAATQFLITEFWPTGLRRLGGSVASFEASVPAHFDRYAEIEERPFAWKWRPRTAALAEMTRRASALGPHASNYIFANSGVLAREPEYTVVP